MKLDTVSTTLETIPRDFSFDLPLLPFEAVDFRVLAVFARPLAPLFAVRFVVDLELADRLVVLGVVARPFFVVLLRDEDERDRVAEPLPDLVDLALEVEDFDLVDVVVRLELPRDEVDFEPDDPVERVLFADFARPVVLFAEVPLFDRDELPDFEAPLDRDDADFAVPFLAALDLEDVDFDVPLFARDEADLDAPLLERDEADFAVPFFDDEPFADLELLEPDLELDDFFAVAIVSPPGLKKT